MFQEYPKALYHRNYRKTREIRIVAHVEEERKWLALGDWFLSETQLPVDVPAPAPGGPTPTPLPAGVPGAPAGSDTVGRIVDAAEIKLKKFFTMPVRLIVEQIEALQTEEDLLDIKAIEEQRPGGARITVLRAVLARLEQLHPTPQPEPYVGSSERP